MRLRSASPVACVLVLLAAAGCSKPPEKPPEIRPVRTIVVNAGAADVGNTYAGEVRPRYESDLGFRVSGKLLERKVSVGDAVKAGQALARLDAKDLALSEASARARVAALEAQLTVARSDYARNKRLFDQGVIGSAGLDHYDAAYRAAQAQVEAAQAELRTVSNQTRYADLRADHDGIITGVMAEPGQVVAAGQTVVRLARSGEIEIASSVPEDQIARVRTGLPVEVMLWSRPGARFPGAIRELASSADPATRTYAVRVSVPSPPPDMKLGMTASVRIPLAGDRRLVHVPLAALIDHDGGRGVWVYEAASQTVTFRPIEVAGVSGNEILVSGGLNNGDVVVTAGAPLLSQGQKVKLLPRDSVAQR
ncbi:MAG: efflux RND transporter periplasmic adaptor subunit [Nevskia sp.]|nr:efflux RND transporter periplasmic adaptor subunit [Nevskia sp.]